MQVYLHLKLSRVRFAGYAALDSKIAYQPNRTQIPFYGYYANDFFQNRVLTEGATLI